MFKLLTKIPEKMYVAVSGGPDSMCALDFLSRGRSDRIIALHFNHGTEHGKDAEPFVREALNKMGISLLVGRNEDPIPVGKSKEEFWRVARYKFFSKCVEDNKLPLIMAHTLDDAMETWVFTSLHGRPRVIPACRDYILRPFLLSRKADMLAWCEDRGVPFINDPGNQDRSFPRVRIRLDIIPEMLKINPGLPKVIKKMYMLQ